MPQPAKEWTGAGYEPEAPPTTRSGVEATTNTFVASISGVSADGSPPDINMYVYGAIASPLFPPSIRGTGSARGPQFDLGARHRQP